MTKTELLRQLNTCQKYLSEYQIILMKIAHNTKIPAGVVCRKLIPLGNNLETLHNKIKNDYDDSAQIKTLNLKIEDLEDEIRSIYEDMAGADI